MKTQFLRTMWRELVADPEWVCLLSVSNLAVLWLLVLLDLWFQLGRR